MIERRNGLDCDAVRDLAPLFVTGALEAADADAVREHLTTCHDAHAELTELGQPVTALLETVEPAEPPSSLKGRLLAAAEADLREGRHPSTRSAPAVAPPASESATLLAPPAPVSATPAPPAMSVPAGPAPIVSIDGERARRRPGLAWLAAAAAVIVAVAFGGWNLALRSQLGDAQAYQAGVDAALDLAAQPGSLTALLVTVDGVSTGFGVVGGDGSVRLAVRGLPATAGTQVYTAWAIAGDAPPVPLADIRVGADGMAVASGATPEGQPGMVLALTLEPAGGATAPTLPIVASGVAGEPGG
ncbi:MAG TPA: anti-sigma factor [Candidatus Limnocylindrales bacterium]|nr:anti-sigma factor [Candidatus Limnocylindrales bacterium]